MDALTSSLFCDDVPGLFNPLFQNIMFNDFYMVLADFDSYVKTQEQIAKDYTNPMAWARKALLNVARSGKFSSDRTITEYANDIWHVKPTL